MNKKIIEINGVSVPKEIEKINFVCDLEKCKGACCTMESEYGAPITEEEIEIIEQYLPVISKYLPETSKKQIAKSGFWYKKSGTFMTASIENKDCVFVYFDKQIAKCAIERAYHNGEIDFIKPISCHLFPIRVSDFGGPVLRFEEYEECRPAIEKGEMVGTSVIDFCSESLSRAYGNDWYKNLKSKLDGEE
ncbi:MAG: DUF3109 family protein [Melioribacteraceae bacterium]|nr:DUF3109 family protein [Melioribacteraceae bacterium]